jgi:C-terminal processing protease CtpA/Prc
MTLRLIGNVMDRDVKVGDDVERSKTSELMARSRGKNAYTGKIAVLIDSDSGSASEVFARVLQLEERGLVLGDRSAGAVMKSRFFAHHVGVDVIALYGASITIADLIMTDGQSLEKTGVMPDIVIIPTAQDIASKRDIVLSRALGALGVEFTPEEAYAIFEHTLDGR